MLCLGRSLKISRGISSLAYQSLNHAVQDKSSLFDLTRLSRPGTLSGLPNEAFRIYPHFLSPEEQTLLLSASLTKLGGKRRRRRHPSASTHPASEQTPSHDLDHIFGSDSDYNFEEGHFDGVIHDYREMTVSAWPDSSPPSLVPILARLYALIGPVPSNISLVTPPNLQTHILHLASTGVILPHVDNVEASGRVIAGVSLGDTRVLRMSREDEGTFDVLLESGSVYIQRDDVRYRWKHEIPNMAEFQGRKVGGGQRLSVILRDLYTASHNRPDTT